MIGFNSALYSSGLDLTNEELAALMNGWRERALASHDNRETDG
jgi:hypothetical protein